MNLLRYEFIEAASTSYNGYMKSLVSSVRHIVHDIPANQIHMHMPAIHELEQKIQALDDEIGEPKREYIKLIREALLEESAIEENLMTEIEQTWATIAAAYKIEEPSIQDFDLSYINSKACQWLTFFGLTAGLEGTNKLIFGRDVCRAACNKFNVIFIDLSL